MSSSGNSSTLTIDKGLAAGVVDLVTIGCTSLTGV